jgi:O-antigen/teichoic acid export membrane protein
MSTARRSRPLESLYMATQPLVLNMIGLPVAGYIVHQLGDQKYGEWQTASTLTLSLGVLSFLGLRPYFVRAVAQDPAAAPDRLSEQLVMRSVLATLAGILSVAACLVLGYSRIVITCAAIASVGTILTAITFTFADVLEGLERFLAYTNVTFISGLLLILSNVLVCRAGYGPVALSLSYLVGPIAGAIAMGLSVRRHLPIRLSWRPARYRQLLRECRMQSRATMLGSFEERAESLVLPKVAGYAINGVFAAGNIPASRLISIPYGLASYYFPKIARRQRESRNLDDTITHMLTLLLLLTLPATLGISYLAGWVSGILFPDGPELCASVMRWTTWSLPLAAVGAGFTCALQATGRIEVTARVELLTIVIGFAVTLVFVTQLGVVGAIASWLVRAALAVVLLLVPFLRWFRRGLLGVPWIRLALACAAMQTAFTLSERLPLSPGWTLLAGAALGTVAFLGLLAITGVLIPSRVSAMLAGGHDSDEPPGEDAAQ